MRMCNVIFIKLMFVSSSCLFVVFVFILMVFVVSCIYSISVITMFCCRKLCGSS